MARCRRSTFAALVVVGCLLGPLRSVAHDIPNALIDRATQVILESGRLRLDYEVSLAELTLAQDLRQLDDADGVPGDRVALFERYGRIVAPLNARGFLVRVDDAEVQLATVGHSLMVEDHPRFTFRFEAMIPATGRLMVVDTNYASSEGTVRLACRVGPGVRVAGELPPADLATVPTRAAWQMTDAEEARTRRLTLDYAADRGSIASPRASPHDPTPRRVEPVATKVGAPLARLLDDRSDAGTLGWLALACFLGAAHALQPGHGKTLVAAASLGETGSARRGVALGLITAGCHLASVVALAAVLWTLDSRRYGSIHVALARGAGFVIAAVGAYRLGGFASGRSPSSGHAQGHATGPRGTSLVALGLAAGFVPCWDAVALVVLAQAVGRLAWGLALLVAFSLGLAAVLVGVGWLAGRLGRRLRGDEGRLGAGGRWLGVASGLILLAIGVGLLRS